MKNTGISMLACDLDDTLLGPDELGLDDATRVVRYCKERRLRFTIATGRVFGAVQRYLSLLKISSPVITNGGALVAAMGEEPLYQEFIEPEIANSISAELRRLRLPYYYITTNGMMTEWKGAETREYSRAVRFPIEILEENALDDLAPTQIAVRLPADRAREFLAAHENRWAPGVSALLSLPHLVEFQPAGVSKGHALCRLASSYCLRKDQVLAVGDGLNDLDMLQWAGHSACVANAHPLVARCAQHVATRPYAEGVLEILKRLVG